MRRTLGTTVALVAVALALPAAAAPVESSRAAVVRLTLPADDGDELRVTLGAVSRAAGPFLVVTVTACDSHCASPRYYEGRLPKGSLKVSPDSADAHLEAVIGGVPFEVTWRPDDRPGAVVGSLHGGGSSESSRFAVYNGDPAVAALTVSTGSCRTNATVGNEHEVSVGSSGNVTASPLSRLRLRPAGAPSCAD
jgi:hypothetical protein